MDKDFKDYIDSKTQGEVLVQLLVFEHATGGTTVQMEVGELSLKHGCTEYTFRKESVGHISKYNHASTDAFRGAIDRAVAEQFGRKPEPPYIEVRPNGYKDDFVLYRLDGTTKVLDVQDIRALNKLSGGQIVSAVDAAESSPKSVWTQVFPPEITTEYGVGIGADRWFHGFEAAQTKMRKETAFTVWRLTVTR